MATLGLVVSDGGQTAVVDLTAGVVLFTAAASTPFYCRGGADRFPSGLFALFALFNSSAATGPLTIWRWNMAGVFQQMATVTAKPVTITSNSVANPSVVTTAAAHFLTTGQTVTIAGNLSSVPAINGSQVVTVLTPTTFSVPVNVTIGGTGGTVTASLSGAWYAMSANGANLWAADPSSGVTTPTWQQCNQLGTGLLTKGPIAALASGVRAMTPSLAEDVMYFSNSLLTTPIKRWNLTTNVAMADLVTPTGIIIGMWPVPSSTDIVVMTQSSSVAPITYRLIRYTTAAAVVYNTLFYTVPTGSTDSTIAVARDPSLSSIWVRVPASPAYAQMTASTFLNLNLLLGGTISTVTVTWSAAFGTGNYGVPFLGPLLILGSTTSGTAGIPCGALT